MRVGLYLFDLCEEGDVQGAPGEEGVEEGVGGDGGPHHPGGGGLKGGQQAPGQRGWGVGRTTAHLVREGERVARERRGREGPELEQRRSRSSLTSLLL